MNDRHPDDGVHRAVIIIAWTIIYEASSDYSAIAERLNVRLHVTA